MRSHLGPTIWDRLLSFHGEWFYMQWYLVYLWCESGILPTVMLGWHLVHSDLQRSLLSRYECAHWWFGFLCYNSGRWLVYCNYMSIWSSDRINNADMYCWIMV